jgi:hypothetical protein
VGRGIVIDENALGHQIGKLFVTFVAQKERLAAVADENESIMRNSELAHLTLQKNGAAFAIGTFFDVLGKELDPGETMKVIRELPISLRALSPDLTCPSTP